MKKLTVQIEINGKSEYVGDIIGNDSNDACFTYDKGYCLNPESRAIHTYL
jgi:hypothetical protein